MGNVINTGKKTGCPKLSDDKQMEILAEVMVDDADANIL